MSTSKVSTNPQGNITYYHNSKGELHNENGAAVIYSSGEWKGRQEFWVNGKLHNENGAAISHYSQNGEIITEEFWVNGKLHNEKGAARTWGKTKFQNKLKHYYLHGKRIRKNEI